MIRRSVERIFRQLFQKPPRFPISKGVLYGAGHICKKTSVLKKYVMNSLDPGVTTHVSFDKTIRYELTLDVSRVASLCLAYLSSSFHPKARLCLLSFQTRVAMLQTGKDQMLLQKAGGKNWGIFFSFFFLKKNIIFWFCDFPKCQTIF